jgi:transcriptional regulatory protein RtcR
MNTVVFGFLDPLSDAKPGRWDVWRPTVSIFVHEDFQVDEFHLIYQEKPKAFSHEIIDNTETLKTVMEDIKTKSPKTRIVLHPVAFKDPWDLNEVLLALDELCVPALFDCEKNRYYFHISTGTRVFNICSVLLADRFRFPGSFLQTSPPQKGQKPFAGNYRTVSVTLEVLDARRRQEALDAAARLKDNILTKNKNYNALILKIEEAVIEGNEPILFLGATGTGKTKLVARIASIKKKKLVALNCATLHGDFALSGLFGHVKGAFTGASSDRAGALMEANGGILFLDEIGELSPEGQAMLLKAIEEKKFKALGSDKEKTSDFHLISGTNKNLFEEARLGRFRNDLLARIKFWTFEMPALKDRPEDILPNIEYELAQYQEATKKRCVFSEDALEAYLCFAKSAEAVWESNFRDLNNSVKRMCIRCRGGRITKDDVVAEIGELRREWTGSPSLSEYEELIKDYDQVDQVQLRHIIRVCRESATMAEASRLLFDKSRSKRKQINDSDRLKKYLARFGLDWDLVAAR